MKNIGQMMKQAQAMQSKMQDMQARLAEQSAEGVAGAGLVKITLNGKGEAKSAAIDPQILNATDKEMLEDLIVSAINDAKARIDAIAADETGKIMSGLPLPPGFKLPF